MPRHPAGEVVLVLLELRNERRREQMVVDVDAIAVHRALIQRNA